ncbi:MAG TPA: PspC domain-containing protein [Longilinea sp.]|nr:PspC domain-containing protein [Longilinea sp.]
MNDNVKRLYRSTTERMLGGVCGGIAQYFNIDPTLIRLLFVLCLFVTAGTMFFIYLVMMIVIPEEPLLPPTNPSA